MIDTKKDNFVPMDESSGHFKEKLSAFLVDSEKIIAEYKSAKDGVVFTNKRIFVLYKKSMINIDISSFAYSKIIGFSTEKTGVLGAYHSLTILINGLGELTLPFASGADISKIYRIISQYTL